MVNVLPSPSEVVIPLSPVEISKEAPLEMTKKTPLVVSEETPSKSRLKGLVWTAEMEQALLESLWDQIAAGNRTESGFKRDAWEAVCQAVQDKTRMITGDQNFRIAKQQVQNKYGTFRSLYKTWKALAREEGFEWSSHLDHYRASEAAWDKFLEVGFFKFNIQMLILSFAEPSSDCEEAPKSEPSACCAVAWAI